MQNKETLFAMALALLGLTAGAAEAQIITPSAPAANPAATASVKRTPRRAPRPVVKSGVITQISVSTVNGATHIVIEGDRPFSPDIRNINNATVITVPGSYAPGRGQVVPVGANGVTTVHYGQFQDRPAQVRITANTTGTLSFSQQASGSNTRWEIVLAGGAASPAPAAKPSLPNVAPKPVASQARTRVAATGFIKPIPPGTLTAGTAGTARLSQAKSIAPTSGAKPSVQPAAPTFVTRGNSSGGGPYSGLLKMPDTAAAAQPQPFTPATPYTGAEVAQPPVTVASNKTDDGNEDTARRVSLDFVAADINDVLKALSLQSGINIVTGNDVKGQITVSLKRVSMNEALDMVTRLSGYTYAKFGSAYVVGTPGSVGSITARSEKAVENVTEFIPYRYTSSANLYRILADRFPGLKLPEAPKEEYPSQSRMLVLTDSPKRAAEVREFIGKLEQVASLPVQGGATEIYQVRYASPTDLIGIIARLVPTVSVQPGPSQGFQPNALGASASFSSGGSSGASPSGGAGAATGGPASAPAGGASGSTSSGKMSAFLILTGAPSDIARAKEVLAAIDIKVPQIKFNARLVEVANDDADKFGLSYDFSRNVQIGENNVPPGTANVGPGTGSGPGKPLNFGTIFRTPYSVGVTLDALTTKSKSRILANPNLSALDGQPAVAFIGDQVKYVISIQQTTTGQTIQTETATVGITLKVTGKASPDGTVTLYVHPEVSVISSFLNVPGGITLPQIATRFVDTTVRVKDGETIAIGGLIREQDVDNIRKVPYLGDLPFFGQLFFTSKGKTKNTTNLVVFITTEVIKD